MNSLSHNRPLALFVAWPSIASMQFRRLDAVELPLGLSVGWSVWQDDFMTAISFSTLLLVVVVVVVVAAVNVVGQIGDGGARH